MVDSEVYEAEEMALKEEGIDMMHERCSAVERSCKDCIYYETVVLKIPFLFFAGHCKRYRGMIFYPSIARDCPAFRPRDV